MKFRTVENSWDENVVQFEHFQKLSSEYEYRHNIVKELRDKKDKLWYSKQDLTKEEQNNLMYSEGYCRGYIESVHKIMGQLQVYTKEVQIQALENMKKAVSEDIDSSLRSLKNDLETNQYYRSKK